MRKITPFLWFDNQAEEAVKYYHNGVTWQIVPSVPGGLLGHPDPASAQRVMRAMLQMTRLDIAALQRAARAGAAS
jgi:predicted 3-demethylubiquinone-9 3-methyltransferase (glyoxalase superfamily)